MSGRRKSRRKGVPEMAIRDTGPERRVPDPMPREWLGYIPVTHRRLLLDISRPGCRREARHILQEGIRELLQRLQVEVVGSVIWEIERILRDRYQSAGAHTDHLHEWLQYSLTEVRIAFEDVVSRTSFSTNPALFHYILDLRINAERKRPQISYPLKTKEVVVNDKLGAPGKPTTLAERNIRSVKDIGPSEQTSVVKGMAGVEYDAVIRQQKLAESKLQQEKTMAINDTTPASANNTANNTTTINPKEKTMANNTAKDEAVNQQEAQQEAQSQSKPETAAGRADASTADAGPATSAATPESAEQKAAKAAKAAKVGNGLTVKKVAVAVAVGVAAGVSIHYARRFLSKKAVSAEGAAAIAETASNAYTSVSDSVETAAIVGIATSLVDGAETAVGAIRAGLRKVF